VLKSIGSVISFEYPGAISSVTFGKMETNKVRIIIGKVSSIISL
jgi:hypothetical protein